MPFRRPPLAHRSPAPPLRDIAKTTERIHAPQVVAPAAHITQVAHALLRRQGLYLRVHPHQSCPQISRIPAASWLTVQQDVSQL